MRKYIVHSIVAFFPVLTMAMSKCPEGQYWVIGHHRSSYVKADGTLVAATNVRAHCKTYSKVYTEWNSKFKNTPPLGWPHKSEVFKNWTVEEKERALEALGQLPEELWNKKVLGIYRSSKSRESPNPATSADGIIVLYDEAFGKTSNLSRVLSHELSHQAYTDLSKEQREDYGFTTNWFSLDKAKDKYISRKDGFVQDDGRESPEEDFSNNVEYYLFAPNELKKITPHAYRWIENHFGDKFKLRKGAK
ncbi:hypothetical protein D3C87_102780 [compost metagenome]